MTCGTPLPAEEDSDYVYVTTGTLDEPLGAGIKTRIFCASKADWDFDAEKMNSFQERSLNTRIIFLPTLFAFLTNSLICTALKILELAS